MFRTYCISPGKTIMRNLDLISRSILETRAIISLNRLQFSAAYQQQLLTVQYNTCSTQRSMLTQFKRGKRGSSIQVSYIPIIVLGWCTFMGKSVGSSSLFPPPPYCRSISPSSEPLDVPDRIENSYKQEILVLQTLRSDHLKLMPTCCFRNKWRIQA